MKWGAPSTTDGGRAALFSPETPPAMFEEITGFEDAGAGAGAEDEEEEILSFFLER